MAQLISIGLLADFKSQTLKALDVEGVPLVALRSGDSISLFFGLCPHQGTPLANAVMKNGFIVCSSHGWSFDCTTGKNQNPARECLNPFSITTRNGELFVARNEIEKAKAQMASQREAGQSQRPKRQIKTLPSPPSLPLIGNVHQIDTHFHLTLAKWSQELGSIFKFNLGPKPVVVISDTAVTNQILRSRPETFRRVSAIQSVIEEIGGPGLFSAEGASWKRQRKIAMSAFSSQNLNSFFPTVHKVTRRLETCLEHVAQKGQDLELQKQLMKFTVDVTTLLAFNFDINTLEGQGGEIQLALEQVFPALDRRVHAAFPYWRYLKLPADYRLDRAMKLVSQKIKEMLDAARKRLEQSPELARQPTNFIEALLVAKDEDGNAFSEPEIFGNIFTILVAGEDTTANTMSWMMHYMIQNPHIQKRMQEESDRILKDDTVIGDIKALDELHYIEAVASEAMRLNPVAAMVFLETNVDTEVMDVEFPKGTSLMTLLCAETQNAHNFSEPTSFRPERWLTSERPAGWNHNPRAFMPFGGGTRFCPGRTLALLEIKMVMAMFCKRFELCPPKNAAVVDEAFRFVVTPVNLWGQIKKRTH